MIASLTRFRPSAARVRSETPSHDAGGHFEVAADALQRCIITPADVAEVFGAGFVEITPKSHRTSGVRGLDTSCGVEFAQPGGDVESLIARLGCAADIDRARTVAGSTLPRSVGMSLSGPYWHSLPVDNLGDEAELDTTRTVRARGVGIDERIALSFRCGRYVGIVAATVRGTGESLKLQALAARMAERLKSLPLSSERR
jgi:hypothetical protein